MEEEKKFVNPLWNVMRTEWDHLGNRKRMFLFYMFLFVVAGAISLLTPLVIGLIFNSVQETIGSVDELHHLIFLNFFCLLFY